MRFLPHRRAAGAAALAVAAAASVLTPSAAASDSTVRRDAGAAAGCLWFGPNPSADSRAKNYAFPDTGANYFAAIFTLPQGASLTFDGEFAHARYQSLNSYNLTTHTPTDALNDVSTRPDPGSANPYLPGAMRARDAHRSYSVTVQGAQAPADPADRATNTLYAGVPGQQAIALLYRVYVPDDHRDATGGTGLPRPTLHLADGTEITGTAVCDALQAQHPQTLPLESVPAATYAVLRDQPGKPAGFPADPAPVWHTAYDSAFYINCTFFGRCGGTPARATGQYSNLDNQYVSALVSRAFGDVLVLRGKLPVTPRTQHRAPRMADQADMRYWSLCGNEGIVTTAVAACLYDEQVVTDPDGRYTIVLSLPQDRPANATRANGVNWLSLSPNGDGSGHPDDTLLILRNMLPSPAFSHAVQNTRTPGDESAVMGGYLPTGTYTTTAAFEALGSHVSE